MFSSFSYHLRSSQQLSPSLHTQLSVHFSFIETIKTNLYCSNILEYVVFRWTVIDASWATHLEKTDLFFPRSYQLPVQLFGSGGIVCPAPLPMWGFGLARAYMNFIHAITTAMGSQMQSPCCVQTLFLIARMVSSSYTPSTSSLAMIPEPREEKVRIYILFRAQHSTDSYFQTLGQLLVSVLITI